MSIDAVLAHIDSEIDRSVARLFEFLKIPSISTDPSYDVDCRRAAAWMAEMLSGMGLYASVRETSGKPMIVAHSTNGMSADNTDKILFYGHYDVQPVDPLDLWTSDPFVPRIADDDGRRVIRARGAADDKGQLMTFVEALRAWLAVHGTLPAPMVFLFEGEEESGSPSLAGFLEANAEELKADVAFVCDTGMYDKETPAVCVSLRGMVGEEIVVTAADRDLHSGLFGGAAHNPNHVLARILADLHADDGSVAVPGFYDDIVEVPADMKAQWDALSATAESLLGEVGLSELAGEPGRSVLEQTWSRPTAEVNGMIGGYTGDGFKTVIPAKASAKVSFRLVPGQDPEKIRAAVRSFVEQRIPSDCSVRFSAHGSGGAFRVPMDWPYLEIGRQALEAEWGRPAVMAGMGGSIPIVQAFRDCLGMESLLIGFGNRDDRIHSPNEKYEMRSFHKGIRSWARVLAAL